MDLTGGINKKKKQGKKPFPTKDLLSQKVDVTPKEKISEPALKPSKPTTATGKSPGRPTAFEGIEIKNKFFALPKETCNKIILGKMNLDYSTEAELVNDAIIEWCKKRNI
jgi:hypothetical protein